MQLYKAKGSYKQWEKTWLRARMWWCGDDYCDCTQPIIERVEPNTAAGYPLLLLETLWFGTYLSDGEGSTDQQRQELMEAAKKYGIPLDDNLYGMTEEHHERTENSAN